MGHTAQFSSKIKIIIASIGTEINNVQFCRFVDRVCNNLGDQLPDSELKEGVSFEISALQKPQPDYVFGNEGIQNLVSNCVNILKLLPMSHIHYLISADEKDLSEAAIDIMKKTMTTEYGGFKFVVLEKMKAGALKTLPDIVTYTAKLTFLIMAIMKIIHQ